MIDVKDEVLAEEPKYRIYDKNGKILFDDLKIEQITPALQEGTPVNKVLFDSIKKDIQDRLLISSKATIEQAVAGTDDVNYMTALKTLNAVADGCKVVVNNVDVANINTLYEINVDDYVTSKTLFLDITMVLAGVNSTNKISWQPKTGTEMISFDFSANGNSISSNLEEVILTNNIYEELVYKIIADIKSGMAIVYSYQYWPDINTGKVTYPYKFNKAMIVNFSPDTFGKLTFKTSSANYNQKYNTFEIKEYRKFN